MKSVETAQVGLQIANILEEQNRLNEAQSYVQEALEIYRAVFGEASDNAIITHWFLLQLAYTQNRNNEVLEMAHSLLQILF